MFARSPHTATAPKTLPSSLSGTSWGGNCHDGWLELKVQCFKVYQNLWIWELSNPITITPSLNQNLYHLRDERSEEDIGEPAHPTQHSRYKHHRHRGTGKVGQCLKKTKMAIYCPQGSGTLRQQYTLLYSVIICSTLFYTLLYFVILCYILLYSVILCFTLLHSLLLSFTLLYSLLLSLTLSYSLLLSLTLSLTLSCVVLCCIAWYCMVLPGIAWILNIAVVAQKVKVVNEDRCDLKKWVVVVITDRSGWLLELLTEVKGLYCAEWGQVNTLKFSFCA